MEQENNHIISVGYELLSETRSLLNENSKITAVYLGSDLNKKDETKMTHCGADEIIYIKDDSLLAYDTLAYAKAICDVMTDRPDVFLIGSTLNGRDLAPRISARLKTGLTADATILEFEQQEDKLLLLATRPALGGNLFATIICQNSVPQMATIRPNIFSIIEDKNRVSKTTTIDFKNEEKSLVEIIDCEPLLEKHVDLNKATIIVAGGRGVSKKFLSLRSIANTIGAEVAASRAVVDVNIQPKDRLVGQTGTTVKPKVYLAFGISGAIQHIKWDGKIRNDYCSQYGS